METPICVIDAETLVDHIQGIKNWIYSGHLRLVVPSCTIDQVEQLYQKSIEPKQATQEAPRSRSLGKPPRKEYPAFDINPRVAREYLGRLKNRKEQDVDSEQRLFFQEKENHEAVRFQQTNEQYTPWKDLDVEEEQPEATEGPPTSWAEALRRKQNLANGISEKSLSKAPTKPKLVARAAGSEAFPWKIKKDGPKISAKDVPGALRPLMSCALWRLHESIERNDANQLFFLSDQNETCSVAQKLNIIYRSPEEVASTVASKTSKADLDSFGDLEREFGVQQKSTTFTNTDAGEASGENSVSENANEDMFKDEDAMNNSVSSEGTANTDASSIVHKQDLGKQTFDQDKLSSVNSDRVEENFKGQDITEEVAAPLATENLSKMPVMSVESTNRLADSSMKQCSEKQSRESINGLNLDVVRSPSNSVNQPAPEYSTLPLPAETLLPQPQNLKPSQHVPQTQPFNDASSKHNSNNSTSKFEDAQEPEDSDEEVVVFIPQPKRLSAQQKNPQQSSRPSTPKEHSQQKPVGQSPQKPLVKPHPKGRAARQSPNPSVVGHAHPQPVNSPTVIDPDAFGRDFRVNINLSPRPPQKSNGYPSHRIRGNSQNAQTGQIPRNLPRQLGGTSPPLNGPKRISRHLTPVFGPKPQDAPNNRRQTSRTSPRRAATSKAEEVAPIDVESRAPTEAVLSKTRLPKSRMVEPPEFVPQNTDSTPKLESNAFQPGQYESIDYAHKSAIPNVQSKPSAPQPRVYEASEFVPRPPKAVPEFKPRAPRPKVFEAAEFVPRDFVPRTTSPRTQPRRYSPEPDSIEPRPSINDVDYVLKSGTTRASARGRGRLWTPS